MPDNTQNTTIILKRSDVPGAVPLPSDLELGEPAINTFDGRLFIKLGNGKVIAIDSAPAGNTYYVTKNGSDDFDGATEGRAKATIRAAVALARPGDTVKVSTGVYSEFTPILVPQNVQIEGAGERGCIVKPFDSTKDIFWVNNNSYVTGFKYIDYSGSAISFPNQIQKAITSNVTSNTITLTNDGTLASVDDYYKGMRITIESGNGASLIYNSEKCSRDVGYMVDSVCFDLLYGGNRQAVQSGVYYYSFNTDTAIPNEIPQVTEAYTHIRVISEKIILGQTVANLQSNTAQVKNLPLGTQSEVTIVQNSLDTITGIINGGPSSAGPKIPINLTPSSNTNVANAATILEANREFIAAEVIAHISAIYPEFTYDQNKCKRDTRLIVDALAQDLLFETTSQSTFAGLQYWNQSAYTGNIASQLAITVGAINYVANLCQKVVINDTTGTRYQTLHRQSTGSSATSIEALRIKNDFSVITNILNSGTTGVTDIIIPNSLVANTNSKVANSYSLLQTNKEYLKAEAIAYVEANKVMNFANVISYQANTRVATMDKNWPILPSNNAQYSIRIPLRTTPASANSRWSTYITGSPYIYNSSSITTLGGTGIKVDGNLATGNKSIISAQFTQVNTNGTGIHILNDGYCQLVSIYGIFCDTAFLAESGGSASMGNCNVNFGNKGLVANGKGALAMTGTVLISNDLAQKQMNVTNIRTNTQLGVTANVPYVGLVMKIDGEDPKIYYTVQSATSLESGNTLVTFSQSIANVHAVGTNVKFYQQSQLRASGQTFEYVGAGTDISLALPKTGGVANTLSQTIIYNEGAVYATSTDQAGNFSVSDLVINQDTSTITGRTFSKSLFAEMTPYILALEG